MNNLVIGSRGLCNADIILVQHCNTYISAFLSSFIASLSAGDVVTLRAYNAGGNRGTAGATVDMGLTLFQIR